MIERFKLLGWAVLALLAFSAGMTSTAGAIELDPLPASIANPVSFKFESKAGEKNKFESLAKKVVECASVKGAGELTGPASGGMEFKYAGCVNPATGVKCTGLNDAVEGEILFKSESTYLRHLLSTSGTPEEVSMLVRTGSVHFKCALALFILQGCISSMDLLTEPKGVGILEKLRESIYVSFLQEKGEQKPASVDSADSSAMEECSVSVKEGAGEFESAAQLASVTMSVFKQNNVAVTLLVDLLK